MRSVGGAKISKPAVLYVPYIGSPVDDVVSVMLENRTRRPRDDF